MTNDSRVRGSRHFKGTQFSEDGFLAPSTPSRCSRLGTQKSKVTLENHSLNGQSFIRATANHFVNSQLAACKQYPQLMDTLSSHSLRLQKQSVQ